MYRQHISSKTVDSYSGQEPRCFLTQVIAGIFKKAPEILHLECLDISTMQWKDHSDLKVIIEREHFDEGTFRKAFKAVEFYTRNKWVVNKNKTKTVGFFHLNLTREQHARKQVQMHNVARNLTQRLDKMAINNFGHTFTYGKVFNADFRW